MSCVRGIHCEYVHLVYYITAQYGWMNTFQLKVDALSHLVLQVHLGPNGEEWLHHISMTFDTGSHEGGPAILSNKMRENAVITVVNIKQTIEKRMNIPQTHLCLAEEGSVRLITPLTDMIQHLSIG